MMDPGTFVTGTGEGVLVEGITLGEGIVVSIGGGGAVGVRVGFGMNIGSTEIVLLAPGVGVRY
jgi:hypothetical protein